MNQYEHLDLYTEHFVHKCHSGLNRHRITILGSLIAAFLAYIFMFTNKIPNHDELTYLFGKGATLQSGRWGLHLLSYLLPDISVPWFYGILSILFITAGSCLIVRMFAIRNPVLQFLLGGVIISFPSQICTFAYMFTACAYGISFCLAVSAAYLFMLKEKMYHLAAVLCMVLSLSIYQAYLSVTVSLLILALLSRLLYTRESEKDIFLKGLQSVFFLVFSLGVYWIVTRLSLAVSGSAFGEYANNALLFQLDTIIDGIRNAYVSFYEILRFRYEGIITTHFSQYVHFILFGLVGLEIGLHMLQTRHLPRILLLLFLLTVLPLGMNCMHILVHAGAIHTLVLYSFISLYVLFAVVIDNGQYAKCMVHIVDWVRKVSFDLVIVGMMLITLCNVYIANKAYLNMHLSYENTYFNTTAILTQLQNTPGYTTDSKIAIIGDHKEPSFYDTYFSDLESMIGVGGVSLNTYSIEYFFEYYNGIALNLASPEEIDALSQSTVLQDMQCYPNCGYIQTIDDTIVIKLSNPVS